MTLINNVDPFIYSLKLDNYFTHHRSDHKRKAQYFWLLYNYYYNFPIVCIFTQSSEKYKIQFMTKLFLYDIHE